MGLPDNFQRAFIIFVNKELGDLITVLNKHTLAMEEHTKAMQELSKAIIWAYGDKK